MKASILARKIHKWVTLIVGIQVLFWMLSGAYMATINLDFIHGDSLVRNLHEPLPADASGYYSITEIVDRFPQAVSVNFESRNAVPYFVVRSASETLLLDAHTGQLLPPISRDQAVVLANYYYTGDSSVSDAELLTDADSMPQEIRGGPLPLWRVTFGDRISTTFYILPSTGKLLTRRHAFWRLYDFLWMFHIMDYENRTDVNNNLLRFAAMVGFAMALSGVWLLIHSLRGRRVTDASLSAATDQRGRSYGPVPKTS